MAFFIGEKKMTPKIYVVLEHAISCGVEYGVRRAYKHETGTPPTEAQVATITNEVMNALYEWFDIGDENV